MLTQQSLTLQDLKNLNRIIISTQNSSNDKEIIIMIIKNIIMIINEYNNGNKNLNTLEVPDILVTKDCI